MYMLYVCRKRANDGLFCTHFTLCNRNMRIFFKFDMNGRVCVLCRGIAFKLYFIFKKEKWNESFPSFHITDDAVSFFSEYNEGQREKQSNHYYIYCACFPFLYVFIQLCGY